MPTITIKAEGTGTTRVLERRLIEDAEPEAVAETTLETGQSIDIELGNHAEIVISKHGATPAPKG